MTDILLLHGPNLNLLGQREPDIYGHTTLADVNVRLVEYAAQAGLKLDYLQSNWEGALIDRIHQAFADGTRFILINPAALTHTSIGLRDALLGTKIPFIEVHLSNVHAREPFRHHSYLADQAVGVIAGLGVDGYYFALMAAISRLQQQGFITRQGH